MVGQTQSNLIFFLLSFIKYIFSVSGQLKEQPCVPLAYGPKYTKAQSTGVSHITLRWFKEMPSGYNFKVNYKTKNSSAGLQSDNGETSFGPMFAFQAYNLQPDSKYDLSVQHVCKDDPSKESGFIAANAYTMREGELKSLTSTLKRLPQFSQLSKLLK